MKKLLLAHKRFSQNSQPNVCAFKNIHVIIYYYYLIYNFVIFGWYNVHNFNYTLPKIPLQKKNHCHLKTKLHSVLTFHVSKFSGDDEAATETRRSTSGNFWEF